MGLQDSPSTMLRSEDGFRENRDFQAVIVGASVAGCCTALKLANQGIKVAVVEKQSLPARYKKMCSHIIHPAGVKVLAGLGLWDALAAQGGQSTYMEVESQGSLLFYPLAKKAGAGNVERRLLDPALKELISNHPNIAVFYGYRVTGLIREGRQVIGVKVQGPTGCLDFRCPLVIAADGRKSRVARLDRCQDRTVANHRVALFSYFNASSRMVPSKIWVLDQGDVYIACFPNGNRILLSCYIPEAKFAEVKHDAQGFYLSYVKGFVESQGITLGDQVDDLFIAKDTATLYRSPNSRGLTLVGDAFLTADPLTGIGISWAMSSAALLAACIGRSIPASHRMSRWERFRLNGAVRLYNGLHRIKYLIPAYAMAWFSLKGRFIYNRFVFGALARILGEKALPQTREDIAADA